MYPFAVRGVVATVLIVTAAIAGVAHGANTPSLDRSGVSFDVPSGWSLTNGRINGLSDPMTVFTLSTHPLMKGSDLSLGPAAGMCSAVLQRAWRSDFAYVQLTEERDGASRRTMLRRVPLRPRHFALRANGAGGLCTPADSGQVTFQQGGRAFYIHYGFGPMASQATRARAAALLDGLRITPRR